jgi:hypothetical protein
MHMCAFDVLCLSNAIDGDHPLTLLSTCKSTLNKALYRDAMNSEAVGLAAKKTAPSVVTGQLHFHLQVTCEHRLTHDHPRV